MKGYIMLKNSLCLLVTISTIAFFVPNGLCCDNFIEQQEKRSMDSSKYIDLFKAVEDGNYLQVEDVILIDENAIKAIDKRQNSLLHVALMKGHDKIVELLICEQADINSANRLGSTPLHEAVSSKNPLMVERLLREGASVNAQNNRKETPLHLAVIEQDIDCIVRLMNARDFDPTITNKQGETASDLVTSQIRSTYKNIEKAREIQDKLSLYSNNTVRNLLKESIFPEQLIQDYAKMIMQKDKKIFFSYCWHREHATKPMVDDLERLFQQLGINNHYRDIREEEGYGMVLGTHIETFMQNAKKADAVVIFLNEAYLRSRNCMYEFLQVWDSAEHRLSDKTFVIRHPECNIFSGPATHTFYTNHWEGVLEKINEDAKKLDVVHLEWHAKEARFVREIIRDIPYMIEYLASYIRADYRQLRQKGFDEIFKLTLGGSIPLKAEEQNPKVPIRQLSSSASSSSSSSEAQREEEVEKLPTNDHQEIKNSEILEKLTKRELRVDSAIRLRTIVIPRIVTYGDFFDCWQEIKELCDKINETLGVEALEVQKNAKAGSMQAIRAANDEKSRNRQYGLSKQSLNNCYARLLRSKGAYADRLLREPDAGSRPFNDLGMLSGMIEKYLMETMTLHQELHGVPHPRLDEISHMK